MLDNVYYWDWSNTTEVKFNGVTYVIYWTSDRLFDDGRSFMRVGDVLNLPTSIHQSF